MTATHPQAPASPQPEAEAQKAVSWLTVCGPTAGCGAQYAGNLAQCPNCGKVNFGLPAGTPLIAAPTTQAVKVPLTPEQIKRELDAAKVPDSEDDAYDFQVWRACERFYGIHPTEGERSHD